jgi:hypothetical protein
MQHRTRDVLIRQRTQIINALRANASPIVRLLLHRGEGTTLGSERYGNRYPDLLLNHPLGGLSGSVDTPQMTHKDILRHSSDL